jgi:hypothetical protein
MGASAFWSSLAVNDLHDGVLLIEDLFGPVFLVLLLFLLF